MVFKRLKRLSEREGKVGFTQEQKYWLYNSGDESQDEESAVMRSA